MAQCDQCSGVADAGCGLLFFRVSERVESRIELRLCRKCALGLEKRLKRVIVGSNNLMKRRDLMNKKLVGGAGLVGTAALAGVLLLGGSEAAVGEVQDWKTGEWSVLAGGYNVMLDFDEGRATVDGTSARVRTQFDGDVVQVTVPGLRGGLLQLEHREGRLVGTVTAQGQTRPAAGQRPVISPVREIEKGECRFVQYSDGSWGVAPYVGDCHAALNEHVGGMEFVARNAEEVS